MSASIWEGPVVSSLEYLPRSFFNGLNLRAQFNVRILHRFFMVYAWMYRKFSLLGLHLVEE